MTVERARYCYFLACWHLRYGAHFPYLGVPSTVSHRAALDVDAASISLDHAVAQAAARKSVAF